MKSKKRLIWIIPTVLAGIVISLLIVLIGLIAIPTIRQKLLDKGVEMASEMTGYDIQLHRLYLSPFHHSPTISINDSLVVEIDTLFVGHADQDTLVYLNRLYLNALPLTWDGSIFNIRLRDTIPVNNLTLDNACLHTDSIIDACTIDAALRHLYLTSPGIVLASGRYPLHHLHLAQADIAITLHDTPVDSSAIDTTALQMAFDVPDGQLDTIRFRLQPMGLDIATRSLRTCALADVGGELYAVSHIALGTSRIGFGDFSMPIDTLYGDANVDLANQLITTDGLHVTCDSLDAQVDVKSTRFDMETMGVDFGVDATMQGNALSARGTYNISTEQYDLFADLKQIDLAPFLGDSTRTLFAGSLQAQGRGLDYQSRQTHSHVVLNLPTCIYDNIDASGISLNAQLTQHNLFGDLHLPVTYTDSALFAQVESEHQFRVARLFSQYPSVDYHTQMQHLRASIDETPLNAPFLNVDFTTDTATACHLVADNLDMQVQTPQHLLPFLQSLSPFLTAVSDSSIIAGITSCTNLTLIDTLRNLMPPLMAHAQIDHNSPAQPFLDKYGVDINTFSLSLSSDSALTTLLTDVSIPTIEPEDTTALRLPASDAHIDLVCRPSTTDLTLSASSLLTDGLMSMHGICSDFSLNTKVHRQEHDLTGNGTILFDSTSWGTTNLNNQAIAFTITPSPQYHPGAFGVQAQVDDISLDLVDSVLNMPELDLGGHIRAGAVLDGLPSKMDMSAQVLPVGVRAAYKPFEAELSLGETPITMVHNNVHLNGLPIYGVDSSALRLQGGFNLDSLYMDIALESDSFAPVRLEPDGPIPVYGDLAAAIHGRVTGPLDHFDAQADIELLPVTNITYPIDKKNMAQVSPTGTVKVHYADSLNLGGAIYINDGIVKYSPKAYPMLPFNVDSGSYVRFNGPIGATELNISASQAVKADVQSMDQASRRVDFNAGVHVKGPLDSVGLNSISFFLEAPQDEEITQELTMKSEEDRSGLAVILLGTGMYVGESNVAAQKDGYALSSILNSKINAATENSKLGKLVDIDLSSGEKIHGNNVTTRDLDLTISKSFFKDRLRVSIGTSLTDNPEINKTHGLLNNVRADLKLVKSGNVLAHVFSRIDYDNVLEGELNKSGLGIRAFKDWKYPKNDSLQYIYSIAGDVDLVYRSNNSLGPNASLTLGVRNLMGHDEALSLKLKGAYYWSLLKNFPGDPKDKNTYKIGADLTFVLPYLHWGRTDAPPGNTRYMIGYQYENIAGGYDIHKIVASLTYFIRTGDYITHSFTPLSLSGVLMKAAAPNLKDKAADYPQLVAVLLGNEFVPSIGYGFTYDNYRSQRAVNTFFDWDIEESGNLINTISMAFGKKWNAREKLSIDQFIKTSVELRNKFNITDKICFATRIYAGAILPLGNSEYSPMSEKFHSGGSLSMRSLAPNSYGPGNFYSPKFNQAIFHTGDIKLEANVEFRFPIVWKLRGAVFVDAGNVWNWQDTWDVAHKIGEDDWTKMFGFTEDVEDGFKIKNIGKQLALGCGFGLRLDIESLVIRLDLGVGLHMPYQTYKYDKSGKLTETPINTYYNIPRAWDGLRLNFGIGYPF